MFDICAHSYESFRLKVGKGTGGIIWLDLIIDGTTVGSIFLHSEHEKQNAPAAADALNYLLSEETGVGFIHIKELA